MPASRWVALALIGLAAFARPAAAQNPAPVTIDITYLGLAQTRSLPLSYLDQPPKDEGIQGAKLGLTDNETTGKFIQQSWHLEESIVPDGDAAVASFKQLVASGHRNFVLDLPAPLLVKIADLPEAKDANLLDATATDDSLRAADCRRNMLHLLPSRAMLADALMQYLTAKKWSHILLVTGQDEADKLYADAIRHAAKKFQIHIVEDKPWTYDPGARRTDTGHYAIEAEVARFTQGISYDVLVVADEADNFGDDLGYRQTDPRPVAGTQGLVPTSWARPFEQWGGTQLQNRFLKQAGRWMTEHDYGAWMAVRAFGEAATRGGSADPAAIGSFMRGTDFQLAAFKGARLTFRAWDGQLRQPVLLTDPHSLVSVSPQPGFLHEFSELDTLGVDKPETLCHMQ